MKRVGSEPNEGYYPGMFAHDIGRTFNYYRSEEHPYCHVLRSRLRVGIQSSAPLAPIIIAPKERILRGCAAYDGAIDDEQAIGIAVLSVSHVLKEAAHL